MSSAIINKSYSTFLHLLLLNKPEPLLHRSILTSNFVDRSFLSSLTILLASSSSLPLFDEPIPPCHLFHPLISLTSRCTIHLSRHFHPHLPLTNTSYCYASNATQKADPGHGKLKLRDWLYRQRRLGASRADSYSYSCCFEM